MKNISSPFTLIYKVTWLVFGVVFLIAFASILTTKDTTIEDKLIISFAILPFALFMIWIASKLTRISLIKNGIFTKGIFRSEEIMINNIYDLTDLWFIYPRMVILKFNTKTKFGQWTLLIPRREGFVTAKTPGFDALKRAIGK